MDKDSDKPTDDYIGKFETTVNSGTKEVEIQGPILHRIRGNFWFKVSTSKCLHLLSLPIMFWID